MNTRYVVTSLTDDYAEYIYDTLYCAREQPEGLTKLHSASDG